MSMLGEDNLPYDIFSIIFIVVILSLVLQGSFLPTVTTKLDIISLNDEVMKTFNDYTDEKDICFL